MMGHDTAIASNYESFWNSIYVVTLANFVARVEQHPELKMILLNEWANRGPVRILAHC